MTDGKISHNSSAAGVGGIRVSGASGLSLAGNAAIQYNEGATGGVFMEDGVFTLSGGSSVSRNTASAVAAAVTGAGVHLVRSSMTMSGAATVSMNVGSGETSSAGGVYMEDNCSLTLDGNAQISANESEVNIQDIIVFYGILKDGTGGVSMKNNCRLVLAGNSRISSNTGTEGGAVFMKNNCSLRMKSGSAITANKQHNVYYVPGGGVVRGEDNCTLSMEDSSRFVGNASYYPDVSLLGGCSMSMADNSGFSTGGTSLYDDGHILLVSCVSFTMKDTSYLQDLHSTAVCIKDGGNFTMQDRASITNVYEGRGVRVGDGAEFILKDNAGISRSGATGHGGGGVSVEGTGRFIMQGGVLSENFAGTTTGHGGGVLLESGGTPYFKMEGGVIRANQGGIHWGPFDYGNGGGVAVLSGTFEKTGGWIYGTDAGAVSGNPADANNAPSGAHAVFVAAGLDGIGSNISLADTVGPGKTLQRPYSNTGVWSD
jgi:hypothetical protein